MSLCVFPGSFDPLTCGHRNLIERAAAVFDTVIVTVMINRAKEGTIPFPERVRMIRKACSDLPNVTVDLWKGLLSDYMRKFPGGIVIRGVRSSGEFDQEILAADINRRLCPRTETLFIPAAAEWSALSSSAVREIASFGGNIRPFVPECIYKDIMEWLGHAEQRE